MSMRTLAVLAAALVVVCSSAHPCTNLFAAAGESRIAASNLDCDNYFPRIWFVPGNDHELGRFCFGTDENERIAEGGMNERGLFIAVNALDENSGWSADPRLPDWTEWEGWYESGVPDGILSRCATVAEAVEVFRSYNLLTLAHVKFLVADAGGASAIVEWSDGALRVIERGEAKYQVSTNTRTSALDAGSTTCQRHEIAVDLLRRAAMPASHELVARVLSATHLEFQTPTVLSAVCDLVNRRIQVFYFHYFEQTIDFDLQQELERGRHGALLRDLAPVRPYVSRVYEGFAGRQEK